ncbi:MAG: hypothetical protein C5B50_14555 [Verrucomicrobia bacterium]|nr:MAG: hypothetical protein C5B50_14555 [Verrucomicrobiota bacterium]
MKNERIHQPLRISLKDLSARKDVRGGVSHITNSGKNTSGNGSKPSSSQPAASKPTGGSQLSSVFT